jgi:hypothetical protein
MFQLKLKTYLGENTLGFNYISMEIYMKFIEFQLGNVFDSIEIQLKSKRKIRIELEWYLKCNHSEKFFGYQFAFI